MSKHPTHIGEASADKRMQAAAGLRAWADRVQAGEVESIAVAIIHGEGKRAHIAFQPVLDDADSFRVLGAIRILDELVARKTWETLEARDSEFELPEDGA